MAVTNAERRILDGISLEEPWKLVETFSTMPRWRPEDVNKGADVIVSRLKALGVPVECMSRRFISRSAFRFGGGRRKIFRAKPPSSALSVPGGRTARLVKLEANPKALRSYNRDIATLFAGSIRSIEEVKQKVGGAIVVMSGFGNPALTSLIEEWGRHRLIAVNPGVDIHWGTCTDSWGSPDLADLPRKPKIPVVAVNNPCGRELMALADKGGEGNHLYRPDGRLVQTRRFRSQPFPARAMHTTSCWSNGHYDSWDVGW